MLDLDPNHLRALCIFNAWAMTRTMATMQSGTRFVHYTSADTAMRVIQGRSVWMRKTSCMNDFMEIDYGLGLLRAAYTEQNEAIKGTFDDLFPGFTATLEERFNSWIPHFQRDTYIACLSEHDEAENDIGRLSMWRAYGGDTGVAIVLNPGVFFRPTDAIKAYTSPVAYLRPTEFYAQFSIMLANVRKKAEFVKSLGQEPVIGYVFEAFRAAMLCTKHPGFAEEREWRIIYSPTYVKSERIGTEIVSVGGSPQPICKLPLKNVPEEDLIGAEIPELVERIIIGPAKYPAVIAEAFATLLGEAGVPNPRARIAISHIPLRR